MFEGNLRTGLKTLVLQTFLFAFLILGSMTSSNNLQAAGMRSEIVESFALGSISVSRSMQLLELSIMVKHTNRKKAHAVIRRCSHKQARNI